MGTRTRLAGFGLGLAVLFGAGYAVGQATAPAAGPGNQATAGHDMTGMDGMTGKDGPDMGGSGDAHRHGGGPGAGGMDHGVGGLAVQDRGYRLLRLSSDPVAGRPGELSFQVVGPDDRPVTSFVNTHEKPLHLIVARRDLSGFQHLHPALAPDGTWRIPLTLPAAGDYRMIADFVPDGRPDTLVLGSDLAVAGDYRPVPLPAPATDTSVDGYQVRMARDGDLIRFTVSRAGAPVTDLQPYLGAYGHLVALRQGDLGYLHVHPQGGPGSGPPGPEITFGAVLPPGSDYRLYLQFQHGTGVHTAEFSVAAR